MSIFGELQRRKVIKTCLAYVVLCWLILQIADVMIPILDLPNWVAKLILLLLMVGLPLVAILSWMFDLSAHGIIRDTVVRPPPSLAPQPSVEMESGSVGLRSAGSGIVLMSVLFSVAAATTIHLHESRQIGREMERLVRLMAWEMERQLVHESTSLEVLRERILAPQSFDLSAFQEYAERLLIEHDGVRAVEWVPRVKRAELQSFQETMRAYYPGFQVKQFDETGNEVLTMEGDEFFPVTFTIPKAGNDPAIGYDLGSHPIRRDAIDRTIAKGSHQSSEVIRLVQTGRPGLLLFKPVFRNSLFPVSERARQENLLGLVLCVIDLDALTKLAVSSIPGAPLFEGRILLKNRVSPESSPEVTFSSARTEEYASTYRATAAWGDQFGVSWLLEIEPSRAMVRDAYSTLHWWVGCVGLLVSMLIALMVRYLYNNALRTPSSGMEMAPSTTLPSLSQDSSLREVRPFKDISSLDR